MLTRKNQIANMDVLTRIGIIRVEEKFPRLRLINVGGEAIAKRDVELYAAHFSQNCIFATTLAATETGTLRRYFVDKSTQITDRFVPPRWP